MAKTDNYTALLLKIKTKTTANELKKALTHKSFYKNEKGNHNSRYIFCGMYAFKGLVAQILYDWFPHEGTQLQHILGNLFKPEILERIFAYYDLEKLIRYGTELDAEKHRSVFVYGFLGFLFTHTPEEVKKDFIFTHFILPNEYLFPSEQKSKDLEAQCQLLAKKLYGKAIKITVARVQENKHRQITISANDTILASEDSVSYQYAHKKALKKALIFLAEKNQEKALQSKDYELRQQILEDKRRQKIEQEKAEKLAAYQAKAERKRQERAAAKAQLTQMKQLQDQKRKQAKTQAKERKEARERQAAIKERQATTMSANKRRHLQDKQK
jgi:hypothetical protein